MSKKIKGSFVSLENEEFYKICNYDNMKPFLFTLANSNNVWIYLSSNGGICAGRESEKNPLFPYVIEDKMYRSTDTGAKTLVKVTRDDECKLWQPFENSYISHYKTERNIYKSVLGNSVIFEEINKDLKLVFRYRWQCCDEYGIVKKAWLENIGSECQIEVMDGLLNIMPYGIVPIIQQTKSSLADAYKQTELAGDKRTAVYSLTTTIVDTPTAEEMLKANVIRSIYDGEYDVYINEYALSEFAQGTPKKRSRYCGDRGAYFISFDDDMQKKGIKEWWIVADVGLTQTQIAEMLSDDNFTAENIEKELKKSAEDMREIVAKTDGIQCTGSKMSAVHHMSNVTFNDMRGGLFLNNYDFEYKDFADFVKVRNAGIYKTETEFFEGIKSIKSTIELKKLARDTKNPNLIRLCYEYLPISFSRRHGDPSRPWNKFNIVLKDKNGQPITGYAGNWRDIFQNWEAMLISYPQYIDSVVAKFLNASTADGYNPYRITKEGIDWERIDPEDPFSSLGYWGDHQIIYLSRMLELMKKFSCDKLNEMMDGDNFSYANVPYEIVDFESMISDPDHTVRHIFEKDDAICELEKSMGTDARLVLKSGDVYHVSFAEKLIVPILTKLSNLVPDGGIWMNAQRPEWNDANNAIVGYGLSVVTVYQIKRHLSLVRDIIKPRLDKSVMVSNEVKYWLMSVSETLERYQDSMEDILPKLRLKILSELVHCFDLYKAAIYRSGFSGKSEMSYRKIDKFLCCAEKYINNTIKANKRSDGLYNSYNTFKLSDDGIEVKPLRLMLEGVVSLLGCDYLSDIEAKELMSAMRSSGLYSKREDTYYLYPVEHTKSFMDKGIIRDGSLKLYDIMSSYNDFSIVTKDCDGKLRFSSDITCKEQLAKAFAVAAERYGDEVRAERDKIFTVFDEVFKHSEFMGRSQVMYKYEGIGSVYWHQNAKLLVSVQERLLAASNENRDDIKAIYNQVRQGLGFNKSPEDWGAFPVDCYSHTPYNGGAMQPVMTGQVKEEIITRYAEMGAIIKNGGIEFRPCLVDESEFLQSEDKFNVISVSGKKSAIPMPKNSLGYTICQVPIVYLRDGKNYTEILFTDKTSKRLEGLNVLKPYADEIFNRTGKIEMVIAHF